ncbi:LysR substrate-binding domain-containing protein [Cupriavidus sp. PET2-C1]
MRIDPVTLKIFLSIIEEQSLARAAERHFMATSAVSKRISDLEETLGAQLLTRHSAGVWPTAAGKELVGHAKDMLLLLSRIRADLSGHGEGTKGDVRVYANSTSIVGFLGADVRAFLNRFPAVEVRLEEWSSPYIVRAVRDGLADLGMFWAGAAAPGITTRPYRSAALVAIMPENHPLASLPSVTFAQTLDFDHIAFHEGSLIYRITQVEADRLQRKIHTRLQVTSFDAMRTMVRSGMGLGIMTDVTVAHPVEDHGLRVIPLEDDWARLHLLIGFRDFDALPAAAQHFIRHLEGLVSA